jgi:hypothetical protein
MDGLFSEQFGPAVWYENPGWARVEREKQRYSDNSRIFSLVEWPWI